VVGFEQGISELARPARSAVWHRLIDGGVLQKQFVMVLSRDVRVTQCHFGVE